MRSLKAVIVTALLCAVVGCKVEIFVPEGGRVETESGTISCAAGQTCYVDVVDIFFDETFVAVAEEGFWFQKWHKANRYFCGGKSKPCRLFTSGFEGNPLLEGFLQGEEVFHLQPLFRSIAADSTHELSPDGGTYAFLNGVVLEVPAGAVTEPTLVTMSELTPAKVNPALNAHTHDLSKKRYLGGFSVVPRLEFRVPIKALVPIAPPGPFEVPMQMEIKPANKKYWIEPTSLVFRPGKRVAEIEISHFSKHAVGAIDGIDPEKLERFCTDPAYNFLAVCKDFDDLQPPECLLSRGSRPPGTVCCREKSFTARSEALDFSSNRASGDCQVISDLLTVTYHKCTLPDGSPAPAETHDVCEMSPHCPRDNKVGFEVSVEVPPNECFAREEKLTLSASVTDAEGEPVPAANISWRSLDPAVATVGLKGKVSATGPGTAVIEATYAHECKDYVDTVSLQVLDLNGRWSGTEVADERDCEEGVNTYKRNVAVNQVGDKVTFAWGGASATGVKTGCTVKGLGSEREDDGISFSRGSVDISPDGGRITGSANWTWEGTDPDTGEKISCSGSSELDLVR